MCNNASVQRKQFIENPENNLSKEILPLLTFCNQRTGSISQKLIFDLLANALHDRFKTGIRHEHIYLKNDEVSQIQLFNILIEKFPFVKYSQVIVNNAIIEAINHVEEATIIDIGIGQGVQMMQIIEASKKCRNLKKLTIIGIEPFQDALDKATVNINECIKNTHFTFEFVDIHAFIEEFDFNQLPTLNGTVIVNASLALHHIQLSEHRERVIAEIKKLNPQLLLLIEPNVDHFEQNLNKRFMHCYHHYYNIFMVIDRLEIAEKDKTALKLFFGREIDDVIGKSENDRYEKHEKATTWIERLRRNDFTMKSTLLKSPVQSEAGVKINYHSEGYIGFTHEAETVLAVMCAQ